MAFQQMVAEFSCRCVAYAALTVATEKDSERRFPGLPALGEALTGTLHGYRVQSRRPLAALAMLAAGWRTVGEVVEATGLDHRGVTELVASGGEEIERSGDRYRLTAGWWPEPVDPPAEPSAGLVSTVADEIVAAPRPLAALDHVPATAATVAARAAWLRRRYWLTGAHLLCLGDHDLTSLAVCAQAAEAGEPLAVTVLDLDERLLEFVDRRAAAHGWDICCVHADLRFGLPQALAGSADLVFTDPPYSPEGMALFVSRGLSCLADPATGRVLAAYGYSARTPALGERTQRAMQATGVAFEAILPAFNRYAGAHAVGAASDLYVCQPTARGAKAAANTGIYTRGPAAVESVPADPALLAVLRDVLGSPELAVREPGWGEPVRGQVAGYDLSRDPGPWLLRTLLACNAGSVGLLVPNNHPDIADERGQRALGELVGAKYRLRFLRSTPDSRHAVVLAIEVPEASEASDGRGAAAGLLRRAHGKLGNVWREALVTASGGSLTKREARAVVDEQVARAGLRADDTELRLIDLPRHKLGALLAAVSG